MHLSDVSESALLFVSSRSLCTARAHEHSLSDAHSSGHVAQATDALAHPLLPVFCQPPRPSLLSLVVFVQSYMASMPLVSVCTSVFFFSLSTRPNMARSLVATGFCFAASRGALAASRQFFWQHHHSNKNMSVCHV